MSNNALLLTNVSVLAKSFFFFNKETYIIYVNK